MKAWLFIKWKKDFKTQMGRKIKYFRVEKIVIGKFIYMDIKICTIIPKKQ